MEEILTIGEVARRSGVAASALRFYEERGLLTSSRAGSGHRRFPRSVLRRIAFIVYAQHIGLTLDEIHAELAKLPDDRTPTPKDWSKLSRKWLRRIDDELAMLERLREGLTGCIGCGCLSFQRCKMANPGDRHGKRGPGPRFWV
jgi:MerR family redox-sensitive transcriptional activator SoxR